MTMARNWREIRAEAMTQGHVDPARADAARKAMHDAVQAQRLTDYPQTGYVFTYHDGRPLHPDTIRQRFDRLAAAAGLPRITFHDLRHSYATGASARHTDTPVSPTSRR
jgi:integrase